MEAFDTWKYLHTTKEMKYENLVTVTQKVSKLCEKKHFGSKFLVYKKMGLESTSYWKDIWQMNLKKKTIMELLLEEIRSQWD